MSGSEEPGGFTDPPVSWLQAGLELSSDGFGLLAAVRDDQGAIVDFTVVSINAAACAMLGLESERARGARMSELLPGYTESEWFADHCRVAQSQGEIHELNARFRLPSPDGQGRRLTLVGRGAKLGDGLALWYRDVSFERGMQLARDLAEEQFRVMFEHAPIGIALVGLSTTTPWKLLRANSALCRLLGRARQQLIGTRITELLSPDDRHKAQDGFERLRQHDQWSAECQLLTADGTPVWVLLSVAPVSGADPMHRHLAVMHVLDIRERRHAEAALRRLADTDPVTDVNNRRKFFEELDRALTEADRYQVHGTLLILDVDNLKQVNDERGHLAGDQLLAQIARLLQGRLRRGDAIGRLGGDEFGVLLSHADADTGAAVARELVEAVANTAFTVAGGPVWSSISAGSASFPSGEGIDVEQLVARADRAMYDAKDAGRGVAVSYRDDATELPVSRTHWLSRLRSALDEDTFRLAAQPIKALHDGLPERVELLLRLPDEHGVMALPGTFLPLAERHDLAGQIDRWVLHRAVRLIAHESGKRVNVNLSSRSLTDAALADYVEAVLRECGMADGLPEGALELELTETAAIAEFEPAQQVCARLKELGCRLALDDFGAGFTSLAYLRQLPFSTLKIDADYARNAASSHTDRAIIHALVDIAQQIGAVTIAEGVETEEVADALRELGVDYGQGYYFGRPVMLEP
jgi:diguanylate cyclase (GGDEF)-like protein/PAS domain S-box-containing protein